MPQKVFMDTWQAFLTSPFRNLQKRLEFFYSNYTQETSPDERLLLRGFLWTLRLQFRQSCQETFARRPKFCSMSKKYGKIRECFNFFSSFCSCGLVIGGFDDRAKMFLSKIWKIFLRCEIDLKVRTLILIFQQKVKETLKKPVLSTQLKSSFQKTTIFLLNVQKW